ncbi:hypothetical protein ACFCVY_05260 [Streptomyces sp. NPDC056411]|uniref:hypothetical protein n=1 Tax=Streptomyces sp. NPDC056411 TaxID=3345813 RepID=UPI0035E382D2
MVARGPAGCRVEVHDGDPEPAEGLGEPLDAAAGEDHRAALAAARGRGLVLVRSLSSGSGCRPTADGKAVWFTLPELRRRVRRR